ncbi:twin-arginine translocase subunit TatC [Pseudoxanthomonas composti]|uniref:Sec-independent protein translocase protein TatC n=1 Tax=Pseudoxanthomonas composti TaxID=2137479 RepID=A0A4Q1JY80_9GAMM|nr:twin-arginine translocase subunit TatC [Pseudoxanthomonas composti]RXR06384.1 twin-arginine translocase subunit TatC [Pseudoxanthomonas composti]
MSLPADEQAESSLLEHLLELRARLLRGIIGVAVVMACLLPFTSKLYNWVALPLLSQLPVGQTFIAVNPTGAFFAPVKLALFVSVFLAAPWLLYQAWSFVAPGLYQREKRLAIPLLVSAVLLFYIGCAFAYFGVLPAMFHFLTTFKPDAISITPDATTYLDLVTVIFLAFGFCFELPVALVILVALGVVTPEQLKEGRGYAIVGVFVIAALLTPPDVVSQLMLAVPMCLLYEAGIIAGRWVVPRPGDQRRFGSSEE